MVAVKPTGDKERRRMLGVALGARDTGAALAEYAAVREQADIIELRLDLMGEYDLRTLVRDCPLPLVVTNRPVREGGRYQGDETRRVAALAAALELGAEYVDVEFDAVDRLPAGYRDRMVVSHHDFDGMPDDMAGLRDRVEGTGARVVKVVGMAVRGEDSLAALRLFEGSKTPTIAIAMGPAGLVSRVLALRYDNCFLTYGTATAGRETAPGQLALTTLAQVYRAREIGSETVAFGVVTDRSDDGLLADLNAGLRGRGADAVAVPLDREDANPATLAAFAKFGFAGFWDVAGGRMRGETGWEPVDGPERVVERWTARS